MGEVKDAPLLSAAMSKELYLTGWADGCGDALQALADGRTACVRVMSEDECRAEFEAHYGKEPGSLGSELPYIMWQARLLAWLACARAMGAVR